MTMATILYGRVSTIEQTADHQLTQAKAAGFKINEAVFDNGSSGVSTCLVEALKVGGCLISCAPVTCWSSVGLIGSAATMTTSWKPFASSCVAAWSSRLSSTA